MMTRLDLNLILRETDIEGLVASRTSEEPYRVAALQIGEEISRLNPEEVTSEKIKSLVAEVWKNNISLNEKLLINQPAKFQDIVDRIMKEVDRAQELDPS